MVREHLPQKEVRKQGLWVFERTDFMEKEQQEKDFKNHYENCKFQMIKFKTGNIIVKDEWEWAQLYRVDGNPSCKIPINSVHPRPTDFSWLELF